MNAHKINKGAPAGPCCFVVFGANGDLTKRLLVPALYNLAESGLVPANFAIVGVLRKQMTNEAFRQLLVEGLQQFATRPVNQTVADKLFECVSCVVAHADAPETFQALAEHLGKVEASRNTGGNRLFYLATPPTGFAPITHLLSQAGLIQEDPGGPWRRVIVEKPFGTDLASAQALNRQLLSVLSEDQIYRIDHYLGKETVQNIMILRFANGLFEPIWNRDHIDHVQISVAETVTVERRGAFYDATGALRDMVPNHLFQLLSLIVMEPPAKYAARSVRSEKAEALAAITQYSAEEAIANSVRAQYSAGTIKGEDVVAYREAQDVSPESTTPTYVALKFGIDNWRWAGVPFYLRTGKALGRRKTEIAIKFKDAPISMFRDTSLSGVAEDVLVLDIQPDEGITLHFSAKVPGPAVDLAPVGMQFKYKDYFEAAAATGYETLIYDCMIGDAMLYQRADAVEAGWSAVQPFLDAWAAAGQKGVATYRAGSQGPVEADELLARDGRAWRSLL